MTFVKDPDEMEYFYITFLPQGETLSDKTSYFKAAKRFLNAGFMLVEDALKFETLAV